MGSVGLTDIDTLCSSVRERGSRQLIEEAICAFRGGALRSAIIATWIAVAYDIISKAKELTVQGETSNEFVEEHDSAVMRNDVLALQRMEKDLLKMVKNDWHLISDHEFKLLKRLQSDRNLCAHPTYVSEDKVYHPTSEQVRAHIVHALKLLLIHAPLQWKRALEKFQTHLLSNSFPTSKEGIQELMKAYLKQEKDILVNNLIKALLTAALGKERNNFSGKERQIALVLREIAVNERSMMQ